MIVNIHTYRLDTGAEILEHGSVPVGTQVEAQLFVTPESVSDLSASIFSQLVGTLASNQEAQYTYGANTLSIGVQTMAQCHDRTIEVADSFTWSMGVTGATGAIATRHFSGV